MPIPGGSSDSPEKASTAPQSPNTPGKPHMAPASLPDPVDAEEAMDIDPTLPTIQPKNPAPAHEDSDAPAPGAKISLSLPGPTSPTIE